MTRNALFLPLALVLAVLALAAGWRRAADPPRPPAGAAAPVGEALRRCRALGEPAASDPACRAAWRSARARFLGRAP